MSSDEEAVKFINDSQYGLTCSVWTNDEAKFLELMPQIEAGTVFQSESSPVLQDNRWVLTLHPARPLRLL